MFKMFNTYFEPREDDDKVKKKKNWKGKKNNVK